MPIDQTLLEGLVQQVLDASSTEQAKKAELATATAATQSAIESQNAAQSEADAATTARVNAVGELIALLQTVDEPSEG